MQRWGIRIGFTDAGHRASTSVSKESFPEPEFPTIKNNRPVYFRVPYIVIASTIRPYYLEKNAADVIPNPDKPEMNIED